MRIIISEFCNLPSVTKQLKTGVRTRSRCRKISKTACFAIVSSDVGIVTKSVTSELSCAQAIVFRNNEHYRQQKCRGVMGVEVFSFCSGIRVIRYYEN